MTRWTVVVVALVALAGCKEKKNTNGDAKSVIARVKQEKNAARVPVLGTRVLEGEAQDLRAAADGTVVTVLLDAQKPTIQGVPPPMRLGQLWAVSTKGGGAQKLGNGVTNMPGGWMFSPDSRWILFSAGWDPRKQEGELFAQDTLKLDGERVRIAPAVTYYVPSDDGSMVAYVQDGVLHAGKLPNGPFPQLAGDVSTAEFSADGRYLYFKRKFAAAGGLYQVDLKAARPEPVRILDQVTEYTVLRSGKHVVVNARATPADSTLELHVFDVATLKGRKLSDDAQRYRISRDGQFIAWRDSTGGPDKGVLRLSPTAGGEARELGKQVNDFDFSPDGKRFVFRDNYRELALGGRDASREDTKLVERVGDLTLVQMPDGAPVLLARQSPNFLFAPGSSTLAYTARIDRPEVTRRLYLLPEGVEKGIALKDWLYEYQFAQTGDVLYFRSECLREGRACDLNSISTKPAADEKPKKHAESTFSFRLSADGKRALVAIAHLTDLTYDIALRNFETNEQKVIDQYVQWPAILLPTGGVAYLVDEKNRPGVYVANSL
ncbi:MAG: hypothetical protein ACO1OB_00155 [Archangium sp.]